MLNNIFHFLYFSVLGVEEAFAHTSRVLCFSVHKYEIGFYPGKIITCSPFKLKRRPVKAKYWVAK